MKPCPPLPVVLPCMASPARDAALASAVQMAMTAPATISRPPAKTMTILVFSPGLMMSLAFYDSP